jgi:hypothetical protein
MASSDLLVRGRQKAGGYVNRALLKGTNKVCSAAARKDAGAPAVHVRHPSEAVSPTSRLPLRLRKAIKSRPFLLQNRRYRRRFKKRHVGHNGDSLQWLSLFQP